MSGKNGTGSNGHAHRGAFRRNLSHEQIEDYFEILNDDTAGEADRRHAETQLGLRGLLPEGYKTQGDLEAEKEAAEPKKKRKGGDEISQGIPREEDDPFAGLRPWPSPPAPAVWHGIIGEIVRQIEPHTEADPVAVLGQLLVMLGNVIGRVPRWETDGVSHGTNLYLTIVGTTSAGRKGTSFAQARAVLKGCDSTWMANGFSGGLVSGEGVIYAVRDPIVKRMRTGDQKQGMLSFNEIELDPGIQDKRLLIVESEFGRVLSVMKRDGNTLSEVLRDGWDGTELKTNSKNSPLTATNAHISLIGHVTSQELIAKLGDNEITNGFANRFMWLCARRSKLLPHGGEAHLIDWTDVRNRMWDAISWASLGGDSPGGLKIDRDDEANKLWNEHYRRLTTPPPGNVGALMCRAAPHVMRVAAIYAIMDRSTFVKKVHLEAGLAFWKYCEESVAYLFGSAELDEHAQELLEGLRKAGEKGLTVTQIRRTIFGNHKDAGAWMKKVIPGLVRSGLAELKESKGKGRPTRILVATGCSGDQKVEQ